MHILLVEDSAVDRTYLIRVLQRELGDAVEIDTCRSLRETLVRCQQVEYDIGLVDLDLPDSAGFSTWESLAKHLPHLPFVLLSGTNDNELALAAIRAGAQGYVVKSNHISSEEVVRVLRHAIERFHRHRQLEENESQYRHMLQHVPAIIWTTDERLQIKSATGTMLAELNVEPTQLIGLSLSEILQAEDQTNQQIALTAHQQALLGQDISYESEWREHLFQVRVVPLNGKSNHGKESQASGVLGVALDITERKRHESELDFARMIQESLLPIEQLQCPGFDIYGASHPALQTCGDWYDYLHWRDGSIGLVVGDVSGKGYGPAIMSAALASYLETAVESQMNPRDMVTLCNRLYCKHSRCSGFAILSLVRLMPEKRRFEYIGAGESILVIDQHGEVRYDLPASGLPLGIYPDAEYDSAEPLPLHAGDIMLVLTDGFREAHSLDYSQLFGRQRILDTVRGCLEGSAQEIFHALRQACRHFSLPEHVHDDMTGIIVKVAA